MTKETKRRVNGNNNGSRSSVYLIFEGVLQGDPPIIDQCTVTKVMITRQSVCSLFHGFYLLQPTASTDFAD